MRGRPAVRLAAALACALPLAACEGFHFTGGLTGLAAEDGWFELPVGRWLVADGIQARAVSVCPPARCGAPGLVARFTLSGREAAAADRIASNPARTLAPPRAAGGGKKAIPPPSVVAASIDGWRGARITIAGTKQAGRAAHVMVLAKPAGDRRDVVLAVSDNPDSAVALATATIRGLDLFGR